MGQRYPCQTGYACIWGHADEWGHITRCSLPVCAVERKADGYRDTIQNRRLVYRVKEAVSEDGRD